MKKKSTTKTKRKRGSAPRRTARMRRALYDGCAAVLLLTEHAGREVDAVAIEQRVGAKPPKSKPPVRGRPIDSKSRERIKLGAATCRALSAAGHPVRAAILAKLLEGPATYQALQKTTKATTGPLYHHVNQLRLAGLILPKQRDLYELTRGGRNLLLAAACIEPLIKDRRRRPVGDSD